MNLYTSIVIAWFLLLVVVLASALIARNYRHRNAFVRWYTRYWWIVLIGLTLIYITPVFILTPPAPEFTVKNIDGVAYVRWDSISKDTRPTNHEKIQKQQQQQIEKLTNKNKEIVDQNKELQNQIEKQQKSENMKAKETDELIIKLNKEMEEKENIINELLVNNTQLQSKNDELWDELLLEQESCVENDTREECIRYFERIKMREEQEKEKEKQAVNNFLICLVAVMFMIMLLIFYYESGAAFRVFGILFKIHSSNDSESMVKTIFKNDYYMFQIITAGLSLILYIVCGVLLFTFLNLVLLIGTYLLEICYLFLLYNVRIFSMDCINNIKNKRKYKIKRKGQVIVGIQEMKVMPGNFCFSYGHRFDEFMNVFYRANIDVEAAVKIINDYGINELSRIADVYVPRLNGAAQPVWLRDNITPIDGTTSIQVIDAYFNHRLHGIAYFNNVIQQYKLLKHLSQLFKERVKNGMSDREVVSTFILLLIFDYRVRVIGNCAVEREDYIRTNDTLSLKIRDGIRKIDTFKKYDLGSEKYLLVRHLNYCDGVSVYLQSISENKSTIQFYSTKSQKIKMVPSIVKGKMKVMTERPEELVATLKSITTDLEYDVVINSTKHHPDSHYLSKVYHNRNINNMIDLIHGNEILDVGTNFCDVKLGHGVLYNLSMEEEKDTNRIHHYLNRIVNYMKKNSGSITILFGDVTTMDLRNTKVNKIYMHNCVYNIDLAKMVRMCEHNNIEACVTMNQCTRGVFDLMECENKTNEMTYTFVDGKNSSTLSDSNVKLVAITEGSRYEHNVSTMFDWFLINSVKIKENVYWNKNIDELKHGYYLQTWYRANVNVMENDAIMNNEDTIDCINVRDTDNLISVIYTSRYKKSNIRDQVFLNKDVKNKRDFNVMMMLRNTMLDSAEINLVVSDSFTEVACKKNTNSLYYKLVRSAILQKQVEIILEVENVDKIHERVGLIKHEFKLEEMTHAIMNNDYNSFVQQTEDYANKGMQLILHYEDTLYYLKEMFSNLHRNIYIALGLEEIKVLEENAVKKKKEIDKQTFYNMWKIHLMKLKQETEYSIKGKTMNDVINAIDVGEMCIVDELEMSHEVEDTQNAGINVKTKTYHVGEQFMSANIKSLEEALVTGQIKHKYVTSMTILDMDHKLYYSPFNTVVFDNRLNMFAINARDYRLCEMIEALEFYNDQAMRNGAPLQPVPAYVNNNVNAATVPIFMRKYSGRCSKQDLNDLNSTNVNIPQELFKEMLCVIVEGKKYYTDVHFLTQLKCERYQMSESLKDMMF